MKIIFIIACYSIFSSTVWSRSDATPMAMTTYGVASEARAEFEATGKWPSMDRLNSIEQSALRTKTPEELVLFNTLAEVPGAPIIKVDGVKVRHPGFRLYAISRIPNFERAYTPEGKKTGGRFAIMFKEENGKIINMEIPWIVESEAQIILQQIGGFDPRTAPFVFEETYVKLGGDVEKLNQLNRPISSQTKKIKNSLTSNRARTSNKTKDESETYLSDFWRRKEVQLLLILSALVTGFSLWHALKRLRYKK